MAFVKRNVVDTGLPSEFCDGVFLISTIEHVGLRRYGQTVLDDDLDFEAMSELVRLLKCGGLVFLTTPFIGHRKALFTSTERRYGFERLNKLTSGLENMIEDYFFPYRCGRRLQWVKLDRSETTKRPFAEAGIACLVLRKA
jgi:hypothetical protein